MSLTSLMDMDITTPSRSIQKISDAPGTTIVITQQQIRERGYRNLLDLLEDLPGVDVNQKSIETFFNQVAIRGNVGNNKFIIMQNGVRISSPTGEHIPIDDNFPIFHARQVEVVYGPASALYGPDAFTGVINIITEKASAIDGVEIFSAIGSNDYFYNYLNLGESVTENIDLTLGGHWQSSQNPNLAKYYPDKFAPADIFGTDGILFQSAADSKPFIAPTKSYSAYVNAEFYKKFTFGLTQSFLRHPSTVGVKRKNATFGKDAVWESKIETYSGKLNLDFSKKLSGKSQINYSRYRTLPASKFTNNFANFDSFKFARGTRLHVSQQLDYKIKTDHKLIGGVMFRDFQSIPKTADLLSRFNEDKGVGEQGFFYLGTNNTLPLKIFDIAYQTYGAYFQLQSKWNDWFSTTAGLRFDYDSRSGVGKSFNPRLGAVFKPAKDTVVKVMYSEAFLAPSINLSFSHFGSFNGTQNADGLYVSDFFKIPNPDLGPEKSKNIELNVTHNVTSNFIVSAAVYYTHIDGIITNVNIAQTSDFIPGGIILFHSTSDNVGQMKIAGLDLRADYQKSFGKANLKLFGNYSWVDGRIDRPNGTKEPLPIVARNKIKTGFTLTYGEKYYVTPRVLWIGRTNQFKEDRDGTTSSYGIVHLTAGVNDIVKDLSLFINIRNLADVRYFNVGGGSNSFGSSPQDPRRIFGGLRYKF